MPYEKGSCLNEEYTKEVTEIHELLKKAKEKYEALPECLKGVQTEYTRNGGTSLNWHLTNCSSAAYCFARAFGIDVEK